MSVASESIAVIGGGISGIAAAHYLLEAGYHVDLYEASDRLGGRISIDTLGDREVCFGGKNIGHQYKEFREFLDTYASPNYEYFGINSARLVRGQVKPFNSKTRFQNILNLLNAASVQDLWKLKKAINAVKADRENGDLCGPYFKDLCDAFPSTINDYFSPKLADTIIRSLTVRMNGAEPYHVSLENLGTHLQMLRDEYDQLKSPYSDVVGSFAKTPKLRPHLSSWVETLSYEKGRYCIQINGKAKTYPKLVLALPADASTQLLRPYWPHLAAYLSAVRYFPVGVIIADYKNPVFKPHIRALTLGADSPLSNIGAYGANDLNLVRYTFSGEAAHEVLHETLNDTDLLRMAEAIAAPYFNIANNDLRRFKVKYWPSGLCGYTLAEAKFQSNLSQELSLHPGLYLTGDYMKGASIENCFRAAKESVNSLLKQTAQHLPSKTHPMIIKEVENV